MLAACMLEVYTVLHSYLCYMKHFCYLHFTKTWWFRMAVALRAGSSASAELRLRNTTC